MDTLIRQHERPIYNAAYRMLGNRDDAAGVTQTVFVRALERLHQFNPKHRFFSWIYRIAINESINVIRRRKKTETLPDHQAALEPQPDEIAATGQLNREVQAAMMSLNENHRSVIALRYFSECSYRQIAVILEIPEKTVKSRLYNARQQMKDRLEGLGILGQ